MAFEEKDIATPSRTKEIMARHGLEVKKSLGQNFLVDSNILTRMLDEAGVSKETNVIEIGPGIGALTERLARAAKKVVAFEIDQRLLPVLDETLAPYDNVNVIHADILEVNLAETLSQEFDLSEPLLVVANLPYYITTPIIMNLLESGLPIDGFAMMMQKEVAQRMTAQPGTKAYGSLTVAIQYWCQARIGFIVPRTVFNPPPNIDSAILILTKREKPVVAVDDQDFFFALVRHSFTQRRKTLWNNLSKAYVNESVTKADLEKLLAQVQIDPSRRAETLTIEEFANLANAFYGAGIR
ncbi:16S rRNA (adenine(1518)-N(6)/adenine(1519)-N(6))-dimethyltransferase RsmA [Granulicatella seriolae]|uniref:Ribosomal RNA small subunit methyltransferase A n=1 Tax=Granulicatella seriolae TaxID=2967226 RepID=A0ABT1WNN0_9LACT|nr:16S rRNA (adenine(1518)-N(6)/adenine(1519)-N(6))-dimethyltransferase RsmA [Granulicatella seriolae]